MHCFLCLLNECRLRNDLVRLALDNTRIGNLKMFSRLFGRNLPSNLVVISVKMPHLFQHKIVRVKIKVKVVRAHVMKAV
jgi:hypothetical protein